MREMLYLKSERLETAGLVLALIAMPEQARRSVLRIFYFLRLH